MQKDETLFNADTGRHAAFAFYPATVSTISPKELPMIKDEKKLSRRRSIIQDYSLNTSTHGLLGIARSQSLYNRIFWSISFIVFTTVMIYFVTKAILTYFDYPTQVDVNIVREWPQYFPAVSICNGSPFRLDRFIGPFINYVNALNPNNSYNTSSIPENLAPFLGQYMAGLLNMNRSLDSYYYSLSSILYKCAYNSLPCSTEDFISFYSATYGLCHTFNAKMKNSSNNGVRDGNENDGSGTLNLELYTHSHQYVPYYWNGVGFIVLVHDNAQAQLIEASGLQMAPGQRHKLSYKKKTTFLLPAPYTSCIDGVPLSMKIMFENYYHGADYGYSEVACYQLCTQTYIYEKCGCVSPYLWNVRSILLPDTNEVILAPLCNDANSTSCYNGAMDTFLKTLSLQKQYCSYCSQQCSIVDFVIQNSALASPLEWQMNGIKRFVENSTVPLPSDWSTAWQGYIQKNYLAVSVVRETTTVENITQHAQLSPVDVLSNIGGQTGLWIGMSFLSIMELIEMLYRLARYQYHLIKQALQRRQQTMPK